MRLSSAREIVSPQKGWMTSTAMSANGIDAKLRIFSGVSVGHVSGR